MKNRLSAVIRFIQLWVAASVLFAVSDFVFSWNLLAAAPYFAHRADPIFRVVPFLKFGMIAEDINGLVSSLAFMFVGRSIEGSIVRRGGLFGLTMWGFWVLSGTMSAFVWLDVPASVALTNVAFGLPKCLAIGWGIAWAWNRLDYPRG